MRPQRDPLLDYLARPSRRRLARVVRAHHEHVYRVALRATGHPEDAADVTQDVFLRLLLDPPAPDTVRSAGAFLAFRAVSRAGHMARSALRRRRREEEHARRLSKEGMGEVDPEALELAIGRLPESLRTPLELRFRAELSTAEIADLLEVSERTARRRLEEAHARLRGGVSAGLFSAPGALAFPGLDASVSGPVPEGLLDSLLRVVDAGGALAPLGASSVGASSAGAASSASLTSLGTTGGIVMTSKKLALAAIAAALVALVGGGIVLRNEKREREDAERRLLSSESVRASDEARGAPTPVGDSARERPSRASPAVEVETESALRGRVHGTRGEVIVGAEIRVLDVRGWFALFSEEERLRLRLAGSRRDLIPVRSRIDAFLAKTRIVQTGDDGQFRVDRLAAGSYRLVARHPDWQSSVDSHVEWSGDHARECEIILSPALTISGRVVETGGDPIRGVVLEARSIDGGLPSSRVADDLYVAWRDGEYFATTTRVETTEDGRFVIGSLGGHLYDVQARREGFVARRVSHVVAGERDLEIVLERGASVRGRIVDRRANPVEGVDLELEEIQLRSIDEIYAYVPIAELDPEGGVPGTRSGPDGNFEFFGVSRVAYSLHARHDGHATTSVDLEVDAQRVDLGDVRLEDGLVIRGRVRTRSGAPVADARVLVPRPTLHMVPTNRLSRRSPPVFLRTTSDASGRFELVGLGPETVDLVVEADGLASVSLRDLAPGAAEIEVTLDVGETLHGRVLADTSDEPVAGADIVYGFDGEHRARSDVDGRFLISGVELASLHRNRAPLRVSHDVLGRGRVDASPLGSTVDRPVLVRVSRNEMIEGRVLRGGVPVPGARIEIELVGLSAATMGYNPADGLLATSGADGRFAIEAPSVRNLIDTPAVHLIVRASGSAPVRTDALPLPPGGEPWAQVDVELSAGVRVSGVVRSSRGEPIAGARVEWSFATGRSGSELLVATRSRVSIASRTDERGEYTIDGVSEGPGGFRVSAVGHAPLAVVDVPVDAANRTRDFVLSPGRAIEGRVVDETGAPLAGVEVIAMPASFVLTALDGVESAFYRRLAVLSWVGIGAARTDLAGRYRLEALPSSPIVLVARRRGYELALADPLEDGDLPADLVLTRFSVIDGRVIDAVTGRPVRRFVVEVIDLEERRRKTSGSRFAHPNSGTRGALRVADRDGRFAYDGLLPGDYEVVVEAMGYRSGSARTRLDADSERTLSIALTPGVVVEGVVVEEESGAPIAGARIDAWPQRADGTPARISRLSEPVITAADGSFRLPGLPPGESLVRASHPFCAGFEGSEARVVLPADDARAAAPAEHGVAPLRLALRPAGTIAGELRGLDAGTDDDGSSWHFMLRLGELDASGELIDASVRDPTIHAMEHHLRSDGSVQVESVKPGRYRVFLRRQKFRPGRAAELGPMGGFLELEKVGEAEVLELEELEVRAFEATGFSWHVP